MRLKLFTKFVLWLVLLAVIPAAVVGLRTISINREGMQASILELHTHTASYLAHDINTYLRTLEREIQYILRTLSTQMTWADRQAVLQALLDTNENFVAVSIVSRRGQELLKAYNPSLEKDPRLLSRSGDQAFDRFWKNPKTSSLSPVYFTGDEPRINIIYPLGADHCLYTTVTLQSLWDEIVRTRIAKTGYAFLVDEKGRILAHPRLERARENQDATNLPIVRQLLGNVTIGSSEYLHPESNKWIVGAYAPVKGLKWGVIIQQDKAEAYFSVYRMQKQAAALILISIAAAGFLALFIARSLTRPLVKLTAAAKRVAEKDFSTRVYVNTRDELRDLAETFNEMTTELERYDQMQVDKLVEEKTKTEAIIFSIADGIVMTDSEGKLQVANEPARELLGLPPFGWRNQSLEQLLTNPALKEAFAEMTGPARQNKAREVHIPTLMRYYLLKTEEVVTPQHREKLGLVTVLRNITLEKDLDRMKDNFLHSITHDLRNPMTSIRGFLRFLIDGVAGPLTAQQEKMLSIMDRASLKLLGLINDILDIAKLESGRVTVNLVEADLKAVAVRSVEISEGLALKKCIRMSVECPGDLPRIKCDPELIERVFTNLIGNALKFTPENGRVTIQLKENGEKFEAAVVDNGEGIPPDYVQKIFDKFQQVAGQRKGGTGLGLTICKHIVEAHLGAIWADSKLGEGARFIFTLPRNLTPAMVMMQASKKPNE
ncbi:MAG: ATP-binding protein [Endomicrobiales bacterium]